MPVPQRVFLGWDGQAIPCAVEYLYTVRPPARREAYRRPIWDLSGLLVVTPTARAGRRLLDLLAARAQRPESPVLLAPPAVTTPGRFPEAVGRRSARCANRFEVLLAWMASLRASPHKTVEAVTALEVLKEPQRCTAVADPPARVHGELVAEGWSLAKVSKALQPLSAACERERWLALAELEARYLDALGTWGLQDPASWTDMQTGSPDRVQSIVLIGVVELPRSLRTVLSTLPVPQTALVAAPPSMQDMFDEYGCVVPARWRQQVLDIPEDVIRVADTPRDQAMEALRWMAPFADGLGLDEFAVGFGHPSLHAAVETVFRAADVRTHAAYGRALAQSRPCVLLRCLADYVASGDAEALAALARLPELDHVLGEQKPVTAILAELDRHRRDHLPVSLGLPLAPEVSLPKGLQEFIHALASLTSRCRGTGRLSHWAGVIASIVAETYDRAGRGDATLSPRDLLVTIEELGGLLLEMAQVRPDADSALGVTAAEAIAFLLHCASRVPVPEPDSDPAVELLDWVELLWDDAPAKAVVGVNEGAIPEPMADDPFLPDSLRRDLDLPGSESRYARDAYLLASIVQTTPHLTLIVGRTAADGHLVAPSRLLLACDDATLARRARRFFVQAEAAPTSVSVLFEPSDTSHFTPPRPVLSAPPLTSLRVTAFRDYLACPYRFYLRHVLKLESVTDRIEDLDAAAFGSLLHEVIGAFCRRDEAQCTDENAATAALHDTFQAIVRRCYGTKRLPAVEIQIEHAWSRLRGFLQWHCGRLRDGWCLRQEDVERECSLELAVDGVPFLVTGRIDRIEHNPRTGQVAILDFKSSDSSPEPERTHRRKENGASVWTDLQLPLYRLMAPVPPSAEVVLAHVWLSPEEAPSALLPARWGNDEIADAMTCAEDIVRKIRAGEFWPPAAPCHPDDGLAALCMDRIAQRDTFLLNPPAPWEDAA